MAFWVSKQERKGKSAIPLPWLLPVENSSRNYEIQKQGLTPLFFPVFPLIFHDFSLVFCWC